MYFPRSYYVRAFTSRKNFGPKWPRARVMAQNLKMASQGTKNGHFLKSHTINTANWKNFAILCSVLLLFSSKFDLTKQQINQGYYSRMHWGGWEALLLFSSSKAHQTLFGQIKSEFCFFTWNMVLHFWKISDFLSF